MGGLAKVLDAIRGAGEHAVTIPSMDGAMRPNRILDDAELVIAVPGPDALVVHGDVLLLSSGSRLLAFDPAAPEAARIVASFDAEITCMALSGLGELAIGLSGEGVAFMVDDGSGGLRGSGRATLRALGSERLICPTALAWQADGDLLLCVGSSRWDAASWKRDFAERGATGSVWRVPSGGSPECLARSLAFPNGLLAAEGGIVLSEGWRHRLLRLGGETPEVVLADLPGYPAGLAPRSHGGAWLALFAPRSQLVEFVLRERRFRERMTREVDPAHWIAPALEPPRSFLEPLQGGALKQLGIMKPWAPTRSYGLVVALDPNMRPEASAHSRADGRRHGIRSVIEQGGRLYAACKGGDALVSMPAEPDRWAA